MLSSASQPPERSNKNSRQHRGQRAVGCCRCCRCCRGSSPEGIFRARIIATSPPRGAGQSEGIFGINKCRQSAAEGAVLTDTISATWGSWRPTRGSATAPWKRNDAWVACRRRTRRPSGTPRFPAGPISQVPLPRRYWDEDDSHQASSFRLGSSVACRHEREHHWTDRDSASRDVRDSVVWRSRTTGDARVDPGVRDREHDDGQRNHGQRGRKRGCPRPGTRGPGTQGPATPVRPNRQAPRGNSCASGTRSHRPTGQGRLRRTRSGSRRWARSRRGSRP